MEKFNVKWNDFRKNVSKSFSVLRKEEEFFDVTLISDDEQHIAAHKLVLSASSEFFKNIIRKSKHPNPLIFLSGVHSRELFKVMDYIYEGEAQLYQDDIDNFMTTAKTLKISGLCEAQNHNTDDDHAGSKESECESPVEVNMNDEIHITDDIHEDHNDGYDNGRADLEEDSSSFVVDDCNSSVYVDVDVDVDCDMSRKRIKREIPEYMEANKAAVEELVSKEGDLWICKKCGKSNKSKSNLKKHVETHIEGLSFPCQLCDMVFNNRNSLYHHNSSFHKS